MRNGFEQIFHQTDAIGVTDMIAPAIDAQGDTRSRHRANRIITQHSMQTTLKIDPFAAFQPASIWKDGEPQKRHAFDNRPWMGTGMDGEP